MCVYMSVSIGEYRGQVGIGVLIIFIAMVLIAAIASATIVHESNRLSNTAEDASRDASKKTANHIFVSTASGEVLENGTVGEIELVLRPGPGAGDVNVSESTIEWASAGTVSTLIQGDSLTSDTFMASGLASDDAVISETSERVVVTIDAAAVQGGVSPGEDVRLQVTTQYGATTTETIQVPESVSGGEVAL